VTSLALSSQYKVLQTVALNHAAYRTSLFRECGGFSPDLFALGGGCRSRITPALERHTLRVRRRESCAQGRSLCHRPLNTAVGAHTSWCGTGSGSPHAITRRAASCCSRSFSLRPCWQRLLMLPEGTLRAYTYGVVAGYSRFSRQRRGHVTAAKDSSNRRIYW
jgi:hypothetical protein